MKYDCRTLKKPFEQNVEALFREGEVKTLSFTLKFEVIQVHSHDQVFQRRGREEDGTLNQDDDDYLQNGGEDNEDNEGDSESSQRSSHFGHSLEGSTAEVRHEDGSLRYQRLGSRNLTDSFLT